MLQGAREVDSLEDLETGGQKGQKVTAASLV